MSKKDKKDIKSEEEIEETGDESVNLEGLEEISLESKVEELQAEIDKLKDDNLRTVADFENIKKRLEKEKYQAIGYAHEEFARDLLPVIDAIELAANSNASEESDATELTGKIKEGVELTIDQFKKVFEKHGIELIDIEDGFNPHFHEAMMQVDSEEHKEGAIVQVFQKGYKIKDRVLRPTMVSIAK